MAALAFSACGAGDDASVAADVDGLTGREALEQPACEEIHDFADVLVDTGITYDYEASDSPSDLAASADVVFGGHLTGTTTEERVTVDEDPEPWSFIGYEVQVTRVVKGSGLEVGDRIAVYVEYGETQHRDGEFYGSAVAAGAPVAIFAFDDERLDGPISSIEGFITSCPDGPLLGWTGGQGQWATLDTTAEVLEAAGGTDETALDREEIEAQRQTWLAARPPAYTYEVETTCDCSRSGTFTVTVEGETVLDVEPLDEGAEPYRLYPAPSLDETFAMLDEPLALAQDGEITTGAATASFDPTYGYPTSFTVTGSDGLPSYRVEVRNFTPLDPSAIDRVHPELHLIISNQSFKDPEVRLTVAVDGEVVVEGTFAVEGQHTFVAYSLPLDPGDHEVVVTADTGATDERTVSLGADRKYMYIGYWGDDPSVSPEPFSIEESDEPFGFG